MILNYGIITMNCQFGTIMEHKREKRKGRNIVQFGTLPLRPRALHLFIY
jgi:hypothetical protein